MTVSYFLEDMGRHWKKEKLITTQHFSLEKMASLKRAIIK